MDFFYLIPIALMLGFIGLGAFMWSLRSGQYDDLDGAAARILFEESDQPIGRERRQQAETAQPKTAENGNS